MNIFCVVFVLPPYFAECQLYVWEFFLEGFVHVLFEVRGFHVFDDRSLEKKTRGGVKMTTLSIE